MAVSDSEHILVSTFEPDADTVERVVVAGDLRIGWWTPDADAAITRFSGQPIVMVRACDGKGRPDLEQPPLEGRSEIITEGRHYDDVRTAMVEKYGASAIGEGLVDQVRGIFGGGVKNPGVVVLINVTA